MKITKLFALPAVVTLALVGGPSEPSGLTVTCNDATTGTSGITCPAGQVTLSGTGYHNHLNVVVTGPQGVIDDGFYQSPDGQLLIFEDLSVAGTYTITTASKGGKNIIDNIQVTTVATP